MATVVIMPKQGQSVESCIVSEFKVKVGDTVKMGDILFGYETDKAGVNLSGRVVECLKAAYEQFKKEQHTFPNALITKMTLKGLGVEIE